LCPTASSAGARNDSPDVSTAILRQMSEESIPNHLLLRLSWTIISIKDFHLITAATSFYRRVKLWLLHLESMRVWPWKQVAGILAFLYTVAGLYHLVLSPPLHLIYARSPPAGPSSVYVPGKAEVSYELIGALGTPSSRLRSPQMADWHQSLAFGVHNRQHGNWINSHDPLLSTGSGFSGFWYHLGLFQGLDQELGSYNYYCYSSGCLSLVLAFLNTTIDETVDVCYEIEDGWMQGKLSRFNMVRHLLDRLVTASDVDRILQMLGRLNIIVTTTSQGVEIVQPSNREELIDLLIKTTWIPVVTGKGVLQQAGERYLDGGFSRVLHPPCNHTVWVPTTWTTFVHSLNPGLGREAVQELWEMGKTADHPLLMESGRI
jgi:hypothetical protein